MKTVLLHGKKAAGRIVRVDDADHDLVMQFRWNVFEKHSAAGLVVNGPYAKANTPGPHSERCVFYMHNLIMGAVGIDHIDHDGLNNQRFNLRPATEAQNARNRRSQQGSTSRFKGVTWHKKIRKWQAFIQVDGKSRYLGVFAAEEDAALAYNIAALEAFGSYGYLNEVTT